MPKGSGRRPLPTNVKKLRGNPGKRKLNAEEPRPMAGEPELLEELGPIGKAEWRAIVPELLKLGVLSKIDQKALGGYCASFERWVLAERDILKYGLTIEEPVIDTITGRQRTVDQTISDLENKKKTKIESRPLFRLKKNPAISTANDAMKLMKSFLIEFGMTPAARARLRVEQPDPPEDPLTALIKKNASIYEGKYPN